MTSPTLNHLSHNFFMFSVAELQEYWLQFHILLQYFESLDSPPGRNLESKHHRNAQT